MLGRGPGTAPVLVDCAAVVGEDSVGLSRSVEEPKEGVEALMLKGVADTRLIGDEVVDGVNGPGTGHGVISMWALWRRLNMKGDGRTPKPCLRAKKKPPA